MTRGAAARRLLNSIAANVRAERLRRNWSQALLAEEAGLSARYVVEIERGGVDVGAVALKALADALSVDPGLLFQPAKKDAPRRPGRPRGVVEQRPRRRVRT